MAGWAIKINPGEQRREIKSPHFLSWHSICLHSFQLPQNRIRISSWHYSIQWEWRYLCLSIPQHISNQFKWSQDNHCWIWRFPFPFFFIILINWQQNGEWICWWNGKQFNSICQLVILNLTILLCCNSRNRVIQSISIKGNVCFQWCQTQTICSLIDPRHR